MNWKPAVDGGRSKSRCTVIHVPIWVLESEIRWVQQALGVNQEEALEAIRSATVSNLQSIAAFQVMYVDSEGYLGVTDDSAELDPASYRVCTNEAADAALVAYRQKKEKP
jgi:hypothetical protein